MRGILGVGALVLLAAAPEVSEAGGKRRSSEVSTEVLTDVQSTGGFDATVARLESALEARKLRVFTKIDHAAGAARAGQTIPASTLVIFGNPRLGTRLISAAPTIALDLPLKMLVREDDAGAVHIVYRPIADLARTHGLTEAPEAIDKATQVLAAIAREAAGLDE